MENEPDKTLKEYEKELYKVFVQRYGKELADSMDIKAILKDTDFKALAKELKGLNLDALKEALNKEDKTNGN
jgi:hypothetical protein